MKHPDMHWRTMTGLDMGAVEAIADIVHKAYFEAPAVLAEKRALYANGAQLLEIGERPVGYVLSHPWRRDTIPPLNALLGALPADPDTYYVHDLALLPVARRMGAAGFITMVLGKHAAARGFTNMSLVAVNGSTGFWARQGFEPRDLPSLAASLAGYDPDARYMVKPLV